MTVDASTSVVPILLSLIAFAALYVWTAIALSAVFRKSGEEAWKAWVPVLNVFALLQLGGLSGWLVLLVLVPILGPLALWVVQVIACYRINLAFGFGAGMTVLAAVLFPVWATVVGFGSSRWVGAEHAGGVRRSSQDDVPLPGYSAAAAGTPPLPSPSPGPSPSPAPVSSAQGAWAPTASAAPLPASALPPVPPMPSMPPGAPAQSPAAAVAPEAPISFVPVLSPSAAPPAAPSPLRAAVPVTEPAPAGPSAASAADDRWGGFDLGAVGELTGEVTAAVKGAPQPIAAVPGPAEPELDAPAPQPAVTRVPAARPSSEPEPWAPSRSPLPEADAFPEASGEVSAVAGAPDAGIPRSARSSVSAQHVLPEIPDDDVELTVIAHRRKARWSLTLPSGSPVDLVADVVLVGRRPAPSTAYPSAQLVEVDDGTVSKTHLRLERDGDAWSVTDLHSTNGTVLIASDGAEREIPPGAPHRAPARFLIGDAELRLAPDDASR
ncbi:DUF5684 domain-containing protein [Microbacterium sp. CFBP9034]|uniref:DUF5684 domain-containing protein n=1 Tax=Microbacterium sp. CFBP9034 TaxID=3096540 RepID=UPI002A6B3221|nr:DUF5684 domain-containing protein [Microbacterium sp. CFBP9034]MDY0910318.1 DUF5684 domain-containing protein [Microbacterium sp. CFBP9034]